MRTIITNSYMPIHIAYSKQTGQPNADKLAHRF